MSTLLTPPDFAIVVAADADNGIGKDGTLPWRLPAEMAFFKRLTTDAPPGRRNAVIMGRKTYESIPAKFRPLRERFNTVISRDRSYCPQGAFAVQSLDDALSELTKLETLGQVFCAGGAEIYRIALHHPSCARVHLTRVHARFECDTHLLLLGARFKLSAQDGPHVERGVSYTFETHDRIVSAG
ncbi:MAG: bifunctional dihydrofolate reductase-thymidylate synthase [Myxococcaceae bacterium]|nr:bifunctional dihydrofolate reductase-thymidylate synthase [Myxococcaceae bacterium]